MSRHASIGATPWRPASAVLAGLILAATPFATADYLAYSVAETDRSPLPESIDAIEAQYLLNLEWGDYVGAKTRLGVLEVDNTSPSATYTINAGGAAVDFSTIGSQVPVNGIEAIVIDTLNRTGRFRLVERNALEGVLGEQDLAASGRVAKPSGAATGNVLGAQYLVQVVVTDYEGDVQSTSSGVGGLLTRTGIPGIGGLGVKSGKGRVGLNFRIVDAVTSEVTFSRQIESIIRETGLTFGGVGFSSGGALGGFMSDYSRTPIGQAVIAGINKGAYELVKQLGARQASGSVIKTEGNKVWINLGDGAVAVGDQLSILRKGEELIDPDTGVSLGSSDSLLGTVQVAQVQPQFSIATAGSMASPPARGDKVSSQQAAPTIEFASSWQPPAKKGKSPFKR
jgi:curli biogenesis system outer membrane secretion channel CsgG